MLKGFATPAGTRTYVEKHGDLIYHPMGAANIMVSAAGFGGYRVDNSVQEHRQSLELALSSGANIIDTSANYADGGSERLVGSVVNKLVEDGKLSREEIFIVSKGGYLQGENHRLSQERKRAGRPFEELVLYDADLEHCIHPDFLSEQLTLSLARLRMESLDGYLLHNPEYFLKWAQREGIDQDAARAEYLRRIRSAFERLEDEVARGRIASYGISSNTFPKPASEYDFTQLSEIWEVAQSVSLSHHFRLIEFPFNLFEPGAAVEENQADGKTLLEFAAEKNLATLINRPLNAIQNNQLIRLAENVYRGDSAAHVKAFRDRVAKMDPAWKNAKSLSHLAIRALRSTKGVTSVLVGMRTQKYVEDVLTELKVPCEQTDRRAAWEQIAG